MKKNHITKMLAIILLLAPCLFLNAQEISGTIVESNGDALIGATILEKGTSNGTITDLDGNFSLNLKNSPATLVISYTGFQTQEISTSGGSPMNVILSQGMNLDEVVIIGTRGRARTIMGSAVPIDNINAAELKKSGQKTIDQMINYKVPSYNSSNQAISDATAHFDPSELRNMGPSRTLVLINGKRKNQSALVYVNDTPGKGEVGTDMKSIPTEAIERIEVLRDGAAAQYGSDAVAGVINIVLKESQSGEVSLGTGITTEGDGLTYDFGINKGLKLGEKGHLNLSGSFYHQDETNRAGEPGKDDLFGVDSSNPWIMDNPDLGMTIGQPDYNKFSGFANLGIPYGDSGGEFYLFGGYTYRDGKSFALYRAPYWITDDAGLLTPAGEEYNGFQPTFETAVNDVTFSVGNKLNFGEWKSDISFSAGSNSVDYTIGNTINVSLLPNSPTEFDAGAYTFSNLIGNIDVSRSWDELTFSIGTEARQETFEVVDGQEESWIDGGAQSFPGLQPGNALKENRTNIGVYTGLDWDATEETFVGGAVRFENYSDFGSNVSWKVNARQYIANKSGAIRASVSTGFRAPSLHQVYLSNVQTLVSGGTVSNQGTFNNVSDVIKGLGVPELDAETSFNFSGGITYRITDNFSVSADYYNISLDNRVLFTGEIGFDGDDTNTNPVEQILIDNSVTSIKYFVNALDTKTSGFDLVADVRDINVGENGSLGFLLSLNANKTEITNDISSPGVVGDEGYEIFNRKEQSRITSARPNFKALLGINFEIADFSASLNNTYFGEVTWQHSDNGLNGAPLGPGGSNLPTEDSAYDQTFAGKIITDLILGYDITDDFNVNVTANNLLNIYPDVIDTKGDFVTDLGGRFLYPWEVNQFGFLGTVLKLGLTYRLR